VGTGPSPVSESRALLDKAKSRPAYTSGKIRTTYGRESSTLSRSPKPCVSTMVSGTVMYTGGRPQSGDGKEKKDAQFQRKDYADRFLGRFQSEKGE